MKPLVYACAGCSNAGETAYRVARELDRRGIAEMSCLAGVASAQMHFLRQTRGRTIWVIDGCAIHCGQGVFRVAGGSLDRCVRLQDFGVRKDDPVPFGTELDHLVSRVIEAIGLKDGLCIDSRE